MDFSAPFPTDAPILPEPLDPSAASSGSIAKGVVVRVCDRCGYRQAIGDGGDSLDEAEVEE